MGDRIKELVDKLVEKVRELVTLPAPLVPIPVTPRPRRQRR
jgi:hypothetical protein